MKAKSTADMDIYAIREKLSSLVHDMATLLQRHQSVSHQFRSIEDRLTDLKKQVQLYHTTGCQCRRNISNISPNGGHNLCSYLLASNICNGFHRAQDEGSIVHEADIPILSSNDRSTFSQEYYCIAVDACTKMKERQIEAIHDSNNVSMYELTVKYGSIDTVSDVDHYKLIARINQLAVSTRLGSGSPKPRRKLHRQYGIDCGEHAEFHIDVGDDAATNTNNRVDNGETRDIRDTSDDESTNNDNHEQMVADSTCVSTTNTTDENVENIDANNDITVAKSGGESECLENDISIYPLSVYDSTTCRNAGSNAVVEDNVNDMVDAQHADTRIFSEASELSGIDDNEIEPSEEMLDVCYKDVVSESSNDDIQNTWNEDVSLEASGDDESETDSTESETLSFLDMRGGYVRCMIRSPFEDGQYDSSFYNLDSEPEFITIQEGRVVCMIKRLKRDHSLWMDGDTDSDDDYKIDRLFHGRRSDRTMDPASDTESDTISGSTSTRESDFCDVRSDITEDEGNIFTDTYTYPCSDTVASVAVTEGDIGSDSRDSCSFDTLIDDVVTGNDTASIGKICSYFDSSGSCLRGEIRNSLDMHIRTIVQNGQLVGMVDGASTGGGPSSCFTSVDSGFGDESAECSL